MKKTILLVEDNVLVARIEKMVLEDYGYTVITAKSGLAAVEFFELGSEIDLILMDIDLGYGIDGVEAAGMILQTHDVPIVFLSNHPELLIMEQTQKVRSYGYVMKSSGTVVLDAAIKMAFKLFEAYKKQH